MPMVEFVVEITDEAWNDLEVLTPKQQEKAFRIFREVLSKSPFIGEKLLGKLKTITLIV